MKVVKYKGREFLYEDEILDVRTLPDITQEDAKATLFAAQDLLKSQGIDIYLAYGTLLGAVREKDFIKGDLDVDCYVDNKEKLFNSLPYLSENGLKLIRGDKNVFSFRYDHSEGCYIDIYFKKIPCNIWAIYCYQLSATMCPKKYLQEGEIVFLGRLFKCPKDPIRILKFWYGDTWNVPIGKSEKKYIYTVRSHYYYSRTMRFLKYSLQKLIGWYHWRHLIKKQYRKNV